MKKLWHSYAEGQTKLRPDATAVADPSGASWSWKALWQAVSELGDALVASGVAQRDRVLILCENSAAAVAALYATSRIGAIAVPVNARLTEAEITRIIEHARPAAVLCTSHISPEAADHARRLGATPITGAFGALDLARRTSDPANELPDIAVMLYTTGTTGTPKGVMLTHDNLLFAGEASENLRGMTDRDVIYGVLPITHIFGLASVVTAASRAGAMVRFEPRFSAAKLYEALLDGVTLLSAVPQMHALLMQYTKEQGYEKLPSESLRYVSSGAAPLDPDWKRKAEAFYGVALQNGYGLTESTAGTSATRNEIGDPDTSVGPPLPGVEIKIDAPGADGAGEVLTRGPHVMNGYFRNPEATAAALDANGWLRTGDLGRIDEKGRLHILGRTKELIIHGGFNVYPPEVEAALNSHPEVVQCAVIGRPVKGDEQVLAFCQIPEGSDVTPEALSAHAAASLTGYKRPAHIILASALPASPTGKILKHKLLDHFAETISRKP